jgi:hypothetical protein
MDQDLVIQRVIAMLWFLGGAAVVTVVATWLVGWLSRRLGMGNGLTLVMQGLTLATLFYGGSLYFDAAGVVAPAVVESKDERIAHGTHTPGQWSRSFWATVRFTSADGPTQAVLWLDQAAYDAMRPGMPLDVRFLPRFPHIARPASDSTLSLVPWRFFLPAAVVAVYVLLVWSLRRAAPVVAGLLALAGLFALAAWVVMPTPWETPLDPPVRAATAHVRQVREVTRSLLSTRRHSYEAPQPWNIVELSFVPDGWDQPVVAVDEVDAGSVPALEIGARLPVHYSAANPRAARLDAARTWRRREWGELVTYVVLLAATFGGLILAGRLFRRWWTRRPL